MRLDADSSNGTVTLGGPCVAVVTLSVAKNGCFWSCEGFVGVCRGIGSGTVVLK